MSFAEVDFSKLYMSVVIFYVIKSRRQGRLEPWEELWVLSWASPLYSKWFSSISY